MFFKGVNNSRYCVQSGLYWTRSYHKDILIGVGNSLFYNYTANNSAINTLSLYRVSLPSHRLLHVTFQNYGQEVTKVEDWSEVISRWYKKYQDFVGLTDIFQAQENVTMLTNSLLECQSTRRRLQNDVERVHQKLLSVHQRITKAELYSEEHYSLFEQARQLNGNLKSLQDQFTKSEEDERTVFSQLSAAIKYCHEKERTQAEQSKYWSVLISVVSAAIASLITSVNNWVRIREIKDHSTSLHTDALSKYKAFETSMTELLMNRTETGDGPAKTDPSPIREIVKSELETFMNSLETSIHSSRGQSYETLDSEVSRELTYTKIALAMSAGAAAGIAATAFFLGFPGFGS